MNALTGEDLIVPRWPCPPNVRAWMTTRRGGTSHPPYGASDGAGAGLNLGLGSGDARELVLANRARLRAFLPAEPAWLQQVHGTRCVAAAGVGAEPVVADASFTDRAGVVCAVLVADCMPVLFANGAGTRVAAAHAGWRGLLAGVLEATVATSGLVPSETMAWIGPAIGPARFEVGDEVRDAFATVDAASVAHFVAHGPGKWLADLPALATRRLGACGVTAVHVSGRCTVDQPGQFYSYRRDGVTGRMAALIWIDH